MKYINSLVFLGLVVMVTGCQKKDNAQLTESAKKTAVKKIQKEKPAKKGPTRLETKQSAAEKEIQKKDKKKL